MLSGAVLNPDSAIPRQLGSCFKLGSADGQSCSLSKKTASMWGTLRPSSEGSPWAAGDPHCFKAPRRIMESDTALTLDETRAEVFLSKRIEVDFQEWRDQRDWTARK